MEKNLLKRKLRDGQTVFGCFLRYADAEIAEFLCLQGFDFLVFDAEHGIIDPHDCQHMVRATEVRQVTPILRPAENRQSIILRYLETGVHGIQAPMVESAEEAEAVVQATKYQPRGSRGLAGSRAADYAQRMPFDQYICFANEHTMVNVQIETAAGVAALPEIVTVEDIDVIFVGPTDLCNSLGLPGQVGHPTVQETLDQIVSVVTATDKVLGIMVSGIEAAKRWQDRGARFITVTCESMLKSGCRAYLEAVRNS